MADTLRDTAAKALTDAGLGDVPRQAIDIVTAVAADAIRDVADRAFGQYGRGLDTAADLIRTAPPTEHQPGDCPDCTPPTGAWTGATAAERGVTPADDEAWAANPAAAWEEAEAQEVAEDDRALADKPLPGALSEWGRKEWGWK